MEIRSNYTNCPIHCLALLRCAVCKDISLEWLWHHAFSNQMRMHFLIRWECVSAYHENSSELDTQVNSEGIFPACIAHISIDHIWTLGPFFCPLALFSKFFHPSSFLRSHSHFLVRLKSSSIMDLMPWVLPILFSSMFRSNKDLTTALGSYIYDHISPRWVSAGMITELRSAPTTSNQVKI